MSPRQPSMSPFTPPNTSLPPKPPTPRDSADEDALLARLDSASLAGDDDPAPRTSPAKRTHQQRDSIGSTHDYQTASATPNVSPSKKARGKKLPAVPEVQQVLITAADVSGLRIMKAVDLPEYLEPVPATVELYCERCLNAWATAEGYQERFDLIEAGCKRVSASVVKCQRCKAPTSKHGCHDPPSEFKRAHNLIAWLRYRVLTHRGEEKYVDELVEYVVRYLDSVRAWRKERADEIKAAGGQAVWDHARKVSRDHNLNRRMEGMGSVGRKLPNNVRVDPGLERRIHANWDWQFRDADHDPERDVSKDESRRWQYYRMYWYGADVE